jgi:soluble lytic murein transglycosylase-like protein
MGVRVRARRGRRRAPLACLAWLLASAACAGPAAAEPAAAARGLGPPVREPGGLRWTRSAFGAGAADSVAPWPAAPEPPVLRAALLHRRASLALAAGDTARADSLLASAPLAASIWAWDALRARSEIAIARGSPARSESLLEAADRRDWPEAERAAWLARRVESRVLLGDTSRAADFARQAIRVYPSSAATGRALARLDGLLRARRDSLDLPGELAAAEVEVFGGNRVSAARRLGHALRRLGKADRGPVAIRLAEIERGLRRLPAAAAAARAALGAARSDTLRARARLELARVHRDAGRIDSALAAFAAAGDLAPEPAQQEIAVWERGRAAEDVGRWEIALRSFEQVAALRFRRTEEATFRAGLMQLMLDRPDAALGQWAQGGGEPAQFWRAITERASARRRLRALAGNPRDSGLAGTLAAARALEAAADSSLARLALRPGYSFYRVVARDSLGVRGWPGGVARDTCETGGGCAAIRTARTLAAAGASDEALLLLARWIAGDPRLPPERPAGPELMAASALAYGLGRVALGIGYVERAAPWFGDDPDSVQWAAIAWGYPPAYEDLLAAGGARPDSAPRLEPALLYSLVRQESRFEPEARSVSNALGLMQLKLVTARDMARELRLPAPGEPALFDPGTNVRLGVRYLEKLLRRFEGDTAAALCAYNAGARTLGAGWRALLERGGDALLCELAANNDAREYAKKILAGRQAYRELAPRASR